MLVARPLAKLTESSASIATPWNLGDVLRASLIVLVGGITLAIFLFPLVSSVGGALETAAFLFALILELGLLAMALQYGPRRYGIKLTEAGFGAPRKGTGMLPWAIVLASLTFSFAYLAFVNVSGLEGLEPSPLPIDRLDTSLHLISMFVLVVLIAPLAEEVFFRGFMLPALVSRWGFILGAGTTSLFFAVTHGTLGLVIPAFVAGMLLAWLYYKTGSVWSCVQAHAAQNGVAYAITVTF